MARLSHAMLALGATFASLTIAATVIDIATGHQGPWDESVHLVEIIGFVLLWRITPPHLRPFSRQRERANRRPPSQTIADADRQPARRHPPNRR